MRTLSVVATFCAAIALVGGSSAKAGIVYTQTGVFEPYNWVLAGTPAFPTGRYAFTFSTEGELAGVGVEEWLYYHYHAYLPDGTFDYGNDGMVIFANPPLTQAPHTVSGTFQVGQTDFANYYDNGVLAYEEYREYWLVVDASVIEESLGASYRLVVTEVPEPSTWAMLLLGIALVGGGLRTRRGRLTVA